jgi:hypothetical protein
VRVLASLFALSVLVLGISVRPACTAQAVGTAPIPLRADPPRVECATPAHLRLGRFEDGSAWLECGPQVLVRVAVPR